jgi:uncharacterized protein
MRKQTLALAIGVVATCGLAQPTKDRGTLSFESLPGAEFRFTGPVGDRVQANVDNWLLRAPQANPGMLEMFRVRDRQPAPQLVPWAGEFVGKYLLSAIQALRLTNDPRLASQVSNVVAAFIATQAEDGYLGPFPKDVRLLKNWDLWGHYHALAALALWHQQTGDTAALGSAVKAADLICATYLDTGRRVFDAGDPEMNMSILTGMALMHRLTGEPRYLRMAREVQKDWERAGDYLRAGLDGREYFQCPRPRWESLHDLQGLVELWRITGEARYRDSFIHHWRSIRRWDRRSTGAFSSGEQATGNPYAPSAIETCCTVAWMALTVDYLRLTGDPRAADDLELATLNGGLGAQHPSGRWWTYNTPMDGVREASAHTIVFQARAGTPELNCCSVNGPRVLGLLGDWAVMSAPNGLVVNSYLPGSFSANHAGEEIRLAMDRDYPRADSQQVRIEASGEQEWTLRLRIPAWSTRNRIEGNFTGAPSQAKPGSYVEIRRHWKAGDAVVLHFDFAVRAVAGANEAAGKVSLYRGPLLLAYDQAYNPFDEDHIPPLDLTRLADASMISMRSPGPSLQPQPWLVVDLPTDGRSLRNSVTFVTEFGRLAEHVPGERSNALRLVDFASAGATGTRYRSWLPALHPPPAPAFTQRPRDGERIRWSPAVFQWRGPRGMVGGSHLLQIALDPSFSRIFYGTNVGSARRVVLDMAALRAAPGSERWWRVVTIAGNVETVPDVPAARFILDPDAPPQTIPPALKAGPNGELLVHSLRVDERPRFGEVRSANASSRSADGTRVNGLDQMLIYSIPEWPEEDFTVAVAVRIDELPKGRIGQIFSAWAGGMDDPLRLVVDNGKLFARIEAGSGFSTPGVPIKAGQWHRVAAVKRGTTLTLFLDGKPVGSSPAPEFSTTAAEDCALGGNPHFTGNEFLAATFTDFGLWSRALSDEEVQSLAAGN